MKINNDIELKHISGHAWPENNALCVRYHTPGPSIFSSIEFQTDFKFIQNFKNINTGVVLLLANPLMELILAQ